MLYRNLVLSKKAITSILTLSILNSLPFDDIFQLQKAIKSIEKEEIYNKNKILICPECEEAYEEEARVEAGMKCSKCAYGKGGG